MPDTTDPPPSPPANPPPGFPYATAIATLLALFLFLGLVLIAYYSPNYLGEPKLESKADPATKLKEVQAKNQAVLDGTDPGVKMPVGKATAEMLAYTEKSKDEKNMQGRLPLPVEPPKATDAKDKK